MSAAWKAAAAPSARPVRFTFSRDPVDRFVGAYAEVRLRAPRTLGATRRRPQVEARLERCAPDAGARALLGGFLDEAPRSPGRVRALVADLLLSRRLAAYRAFWAAGNDRGTRLLEEAVFERVWPQAAFVAPLHLDFVGRLETASADVARLGRRVGAALPWDARAGRPSADDRAATRAAKDAARAALADPATAAAVCYLYFADFAAFGYDLPEGCRDLPVTARS